MLFSRRPSAARTGSTAVRRTQCATSWRARATRRRPASGCPGSASTPCPPAASRFVFTHTPTLSPGDTTLLKGRTSVVRLHIAHILYFELCIKSVCHSLEYIQAVDSSIFKIITRSPLPLPHGATISAKSIRCPFLHRHYSYRAQVYSHYRSILSLVSACIIWLNNFDDWWDEYTVLMLPRLVCISNTYLTFPVPICIWLFSLAHCLTFSHDSQEQ